MASTTVNDAQRIPRLFKIKIQLLHNGLGGIFKVDKHHTTHTGRGLIHQTAGFAKVYILRVLPDLGNLHGGELSSKEQRIADGAHQHLKGGRGTESAAWKNGGVNAGIKALQLCSLLGKGCCYAPDQGGRGALFPVMY